MLLPTRSPLGYGLGNEGTEVIGRINQAFYYTDPITVGELTQYIDTLESYAENIELYAEIEAFTLEP